MWEHFPLIGRNWITERYRAWRAHAGLIAALTLTFALVRR